MGKIKIKQGPFLPSVCTAVPSPDIRKRVGNKNVESFISLSLFVRSEGSELQTT
jgi:hypothetical protein